LRNLVERLLILAPDEVIRPTDLPLLPGAAQEAVSGGSFFHCSDFQTFKSESEGAFLQHKLKENLYNVSKTAEVLGMQRSNLYKKISKYELRTQPESA
jgi:two-component system nitrogen regulation response regulator NtrX